MSGKCHSQDGAVLIVVAFTAVVLLLFVGLAVDTGILKAAKREQTFLAPVVASAALDAFDSMTGTVYQKLDTAVDRSEEIADTNIESSLTKPFLKDPSYAQDFVKLQTAIPPGPNGRISPGRWHFFPEWSNPTIFDPISGACIGKRPCPCDLDPNDGQPKWAGACFEPLYLDNPADQVVPVNAFNADLKLRQESPLKTVFMKVAGQKFVTLASRATVAARPLRLVFLVNLSRSVHEETHLPYERYGESVFSLPHLSRAPAEYAFRLSNRNCAATDAPYLVHPNDPGFNAANLTCQPKLPVPACPSPIPTPSSASFYPPSDCEFSGGRPEGFYNELFNHYCVGRPIFIPNRVVSMHPHVVHAKNEYRCVPVTYQEGADAPTNASYLVDLYRGATQDRNPYEGPEPLNTMLHAVSYGIARFNERRVDGDRFAMIGFDHRADMDIRRIPLSERGSNELQALTIATADGNILERHRDHFLFPREDALQSIPAALREAHNLITAENDYGSVDNHVILITDGMSHCYLDASDTHVCKLEQADIEQSIDQSVQYVVDQFVPDNIRFSVLMVNEMAQPHTMLRRGTTENSSAGCMTSDEARENGYSYADYTTDSKSINQVLDSARSNGGPYAASAHYFYPNKLQEAVVATNGIWGPARPACNAALIPASIGTSCSAGGLEEHLTNLCSAAANEGDPIANVTGVTDGSGRVICDTRCRDRKEQFEEYVIQIMTNSPTVRVDDKRMVE